MRIRILFIAVGLLAAVAGRTAAIAEADDLTPQLRLRGKGALSIGHGTAPKVADTLDGADHVVSFLIPLTVTDARGTGAGWHMTLTSTAFVTPAGDALPDDASTIVGVDAACAGLGTCTAGANALTYPLGLPAGATTPPAVVFYDTGAGTGMGAFTIDASIDLVVPGNAYGGRYRSTVTFAVASGP